MRYNTFLQHPEEYSFGKQITTFFVLLVDLHKFLMVDYSSKTLDFFFVNLLPSLLGLNVVWYRVIRSIGGAILLIVYFYIFYRMSDKIDKTVLSFLLICFISVLPELWITVLYGQDSLLFTLLFGTAALVLFFFCYYEHEESQSSNKQWILFLLIVLLTHISNLIKHVGRINFIIIFFFLLLTNKKKILTVKYGFLMLMLLLLSVPFGTLFSKAFSSDGLDINKLGSAGATDHQTNFFMLGVNFLKTFYLTFFEHASFLVPLFLIFLSLWIWKWKQMETTDQKQVQFLKEVCLFSLCWFVFAALALHLTRGLVFDRTYWIRFQFIIFIVPQVLFIMSFCLFICRTRFPTRRILVYIIYFFLILAVFHNIMRLNEWRGGWGAYYLGYDTARQYVDEHAENALLVMPFDHASATYFVKSNNAHMLVSDITNSSLLSSYLANYSAVYIANKAEMTFDDSAVVNIANLTIIDTSPYGRLKAFIGNYYSSPMYLYQVQTGR